MKPEYTIIYITNRWECLLEWFLDSALLDIPEEDLPKIQFVFVDLCHAPATERGKWFDKHKDKLEKFGSYKHVPPKPNVWAGGYRLTKTNYFAASAFRNTGIIHAEADHITFIDDVSLVMPGWWKHTVESKQVSQVYLGTYEKHWHMNVKDGRLIGSDRRPSGIDTRTLKLTPEQKAAPFYCHGTWLYGCSLSAPTEAFLQINGYDEDCDSMGSEDYVCGMMMELHGWQLKFCPQMLTIESEEYHRIEEPCSRIIKPVPKPDASHAILNMVKSGDRRTAAFYCNPAMTLRECREHVLAGGEIPITRIPEHDWRDGQPLREM